MTTKEAVLYQKLPGDKVRCTACARYCEIGKGQIGLCGIRANNNGKLDLLAYGKVITGHVDPIEKKPVVHYMPGTSIFSIATTGCNWLCQPKGTKILMANGTRKPIEKIRSGDKVWSYNVGGNFEIVPNVVTHAGSRFAELLEVTYGNRGEGKLYLTREHPVFTTDGWKTAETLDRGDQILKVWHHNAKVWKRQSSDPVKQSKFSCKNCDKIITDGDEWNRHQEVCCLNGHEMPKELHGRPSESQKSLFNLLDRMGIKHEKDYRIEIKDQPEDSRSFYIAGAAIVEAKIDIEVEEWRHYDSEKIPQADRLRDMTLAANGWRTIRISDRQVCNHPDEVEALILDYIAPSVRKNKRTWINVEQVKYTGKTAQVFSFECIPNHNYVGDGILLHNCKYCQNYDISQRRKVEGRDLSPQEVVELATRSGSQGIAYTYNQPSIFIEFARDCGVAARKAGLFNVFVSNGYDTPETVKMMGEFLDCITVDFKGSAEPGFTRQYIGVPDPQPIFDTLKEIRDKTKIHVEITDLIVPRVGDSLEHASKLCRFIYEELGPDIPIHFLRFHPDYKMMEFEPTPVEMLERHHEVAKKEGLNFAYVGNVPGHKLEHTYCPGCGKVVVKRFGFDIQGWHLDGQNNCKFCGYRIPITGKLAENYRQNRFQFVV